MLPKVLGVAVLALVLVRSGDLWHLVGDWWGGRLTGDSTVLGWKLRYWGRLGKSCQFTGGVTVVLKIIGPERFSEWSAAWEARRERALTAVEQAVAVYPLTALRQAMGTSLVRTRHYAIPEGGSWSREEVWTGGPPHVGTAPVDQAEVDAWHTAALTAVESAHGCAEPHHPEACPEQIAFARAAVDRFLRERLGPAEWNRVTALSTTVLNAPILFRASQAGVVILLMLAGGLYALRMASAPGTALLMLIVCAGAFALGLVVVGTEDPPRSRRDVAVFRRVVRLWTAPVAAAMRGLAILLVKARPGHAVEWFAFWAFLVGFGLDFLAS
ncbi:hypothetical protein [Saccharothrix syringae]|uniref:Uncharacterized protein n=1 Tax=Saccharothrix syringae TaxID=103733 RepID=A0A5Q0GRM9_SACSY|nr:hypothetical protein [Saccharothrix syringae]QFZ16717.1 hypothetical protein EKG83_03900 [Saccharothrix syringae]